MKKILPFVLMMLFQSAVIHCENKKYPVKVNIIDGIRIVQNPKFPKHKDAGYSLEEILTIGLEESDNNYVFYKIMGIDVDSEGRIYILDSGNHRIQVFDKQGKFLRTIGREGQGPGELHGARSLSLGQDGKIFITDYYLRKTTCFHRDGKYMSDFQLREGAPWWDLHAHNNILNISLVKVQILNNRRNIVLEIVKLNENGDFIKKIGEFNFPKIQRLGNLSFSSQYEPRYAWTVDLNGKIYGGFGNKYEVSMYDPDGIERMKFGRNYKQVRISNKEKNEELSEWPKHLRNKIQLPEVKPVFDRILANDNGDIWVHLFEKDKNGFEQFDIFNAEGIYLRKVVSKEIPRLIKNGFAYVKTKSEDGFPIIKKYKLKQMF